MNLFYQLKKVIIVCNKLKSQSHKYITITLIYVYIVLRGV